MSTKVKVILGVVLVLVAVGLFMFSSDGKQPSTTIPAASSTNPNDPAIKGLNLN